MSINRVILIGNVGKDPEIKNFDNGGMVAQFTLATTKRGYTAENGTQIPDRTEWHNIVFMNAPAKIVQNYVKKGDKLYIEGELRTRFYDDASNIRRYITEIYGNVIELLTPKSNTQAPPPDPGAPMEVQKDGDDLPF